MPLSRRSFILAAGGAGLALVGSGAYFAVTRRPERALQPWEDVQTAFDDVRLDAFRHAILAPNPHNRQPWHIRLLSADEAVITCDLDRRLPETDPFDRQITIGFGGFLELARIAAAERGWRVEIRAFPDGEPQPRLDGRPIAHLRFIKDAGVAKDPLFTAITTRRSVKRPFDAGRPVSALDRKRLLGGDDAAPYGLSNDSRLVATLRDLTLKAWSIETNTPRTFMESVNLMRIGRSEIEANPDGISLGGPLIETLAALGQVSREEIAKPGSSAFQSGLNVYTDMLNGVASYVWIATKANARLDQIEAGRAYVRLNLRASQIGLSMHPVSQALQEFPEMAEPFQAVHRALNIAAPERLQMLARIGYGPAADPAPRWPLAAKLTSA
ncbi:MAG: twin-arginine translocation pathway signal protein [Hyphomicrobiales bacterium]|nr:twin-arginine translocation pathway signal protein [Hyphomicrobiales bacterium]